MLFIESPSGVGFSTNNDTNPVWNDTNTMNDLYEAFVVFVERFPSFKGRELWVAGESYGGIYVPMITHKLMKMKNPDLPIKGMMVGNGLAEQLTNGFEDATWDFWIGRSVFDPYLM